MTALAQQSRSRRRRRRRAWRGSGRPAIPHITGNQSLWTYYPLASAAGRTAGDLPLYTVPGTGAARYIDAQHIYFTSSMPVVSTFIRSDGVGGLRSWSYGYREAMYNQMGRGMQGFRTLIEEDDAAGLRTTTTF
ncbi:MAG: hypothetical protein CVV12_15290, partial [Gammaproteobacteria bacterium HGW-Gammaproteobacteria-2]